jgi:hypothetical protein
MPLNNMTYNHNLKISRSKKYFTGGNSQIDINKQCESESKRNDHKNLSSL